MISSNPGPTIQLALDPKWIYSNIYLCILVVSVIKVAYYDEV